MYTEVPKPIAINEAIELAKAYDTDDAPAFINGVLNAVAKTLDSKD
jgi:N utilization substance protein B